MIAKKKKKVTTRRITMTRAQVSKNADRLARVAESIMKRAKKTRALAERMPPGSHWNMRTSKIVKAPVFVPVKRCDPTLADLRRWAAMARKDASMFEARALKLEAKKLEAKKGKR